MNSSVPYRLERFEETWLYVERALRSHAFGAAATADMRQRVSAHDNMRRGMRCRRERGNLGDQLLDDGAPERVEVLGHQNERARAADNVVLVVFLEAARRIGMLGVPRHRPVAQDDEPIDDDPFGNGLIARKLYVTARRVGAVAGDVDGTASGAEWGTLQLSGRELDAAADRGTVGERARQFQELIAEFACRVGAVDDGPINHELLCTKTRPFDEAKGDALL